MRTLLMLMVRDDDGKHLSTWLAAYRVVPDQFRRQAKALAEKINREYVAARSKPGTTK